MSMFSEIISDYNCKELEKLRNSYLKNHKNEYDQNLINDIFDEVIEVIEIVHD